MSNVSTKIIDALQKSESITVIFRQELEEAMNQLFTPSNSTLSWIMTATILSAIITATHETFFSQESSIPNSET